MKMSAKLKERAASLGQYLNEDDSITPAENLPEGLLISEGSGGIERDFLDAIAADSVGQAFKAMRMEAGLTGVAASEARGITKGRLAQLESKDANPHFSSIVEQADSLGFDVEVYFVPRLHEAHHPVKVAAHSRTPRKSTPRGKAKAARTP